MSLTLTRPAASAAVHDLGWRYLLGAFRTYVAVPGYPAALDVASIATRTCGSDAERHLGLDVRADRVELELIDRDVADVTSRDADLAGAITAALADSGFQTEAVADAAQPDVQSLEIAIDALDIPAIRPFWKAVLGYVDEPARDGPQDAVVDPYRRGPAVWFQQMDAPRPQRNRIHFDITVPHDQAEARIAAALAAGGVLVSDTAARSFWILADAEGNEICICTWQDREPSG
jgi:4a-hydroxytetrahydrobiopterin dehydratase